MLTIRDEQYEMLRESINRRFDIWLMEHVHRHFLRKALWLGESRISMMIAEARNLAMDYGLHSRRGICTLLDLIVVFGSGFDTNADYPWARDILAVRGNELPERTLNKLMAASAMWMQAASARDQAPGAEG